MKFNIYYEKTEKNYSVDPYVAKYTTFDDILRKIHAPVSSHECILIDKLDKFICKSYDKVLEKYQHNKEVNMILQIKQIDMLKNAPVSRSYYDEKQISPPSAQLFSTSNPIPIPIHSQLERIPMTQFKSDKTPFEFGNSPEVRIPKSFLSIPPPPINKSTPIPTPPETPRKVYQNLHQPSKDVIASIDKKHCKCCEDVYHMIVNDIHEPPPKEEIYEFDDVEGDESPYIKDFQRRNIISDNNYVSFILHCTKINHNLYKTLIGNQELLLKNTQELEKVKGILETLVSKVDNNKLH